MHEPDDERAGDLDLGPVQQAPIVGDDLGGVFQQLVRQFGQAPAGGVGDFDRTIRQQQKQLALHVALELFPVHRAGFEALGETGGHLPAAAHAQCGAGVERTGGFRFQHREDLAGAIRPGLGVALIQLNPPAQPFAQAGDDIGDGDGGHGHAQLVADQRGGRNGGVGDDRDAARGELDDRQAEAFGFRKVHGDVGMGHDLGHFDIRQVLQVPDPAAGED